MPLSQNATPCPPGEWATWALRAGPGPTLGGRGTGGWRGRTRCRYAWVPRACTHTVCPPACHPCRIVCTIEAAEAPFTGGVEVDISGKLGRSPPHVQFTYQVSARQVALAGQDKCGWGLGGHALTRGEARLCPCLFLTTVMAQSRPGREGRSPAAPALSQMSLLFSSSSPSPSVWSQSRGHRRAAPC